MAQHEIKTIVAELESMSPRTQLEIVRLCKKVAELTPDYIDTLSEETKAELRPLIDANAAAISQEVTDRKAIVENVNNIIEGVSVNENKLKSSGTSEFAGVYVNDMLTSVTNENEAEITTPAASITLDSNKNVKIKTGEFESVFNEDTFTTYQIEATDIYADGIYSKPNSNEILIDCGNKQIKLDKSTHEITLTNNSHVLKLDANGSLTLDGGAVGAKPLYQHNITIRRDLTNANLFVSLTIINDSPSQFNKTGLENYLRNNSLTSLQFCLNASGSYDDGTNKYIIVGIIYVTSAGGMRLIAVNTTNGVWQALGNTSIPTNSTFNDLVVQIA